MTAYNGYGAAAPTGFVQENDAVDITVGTRFHVTSTGMKATKVRVYVPAPVYRDPTGETTWVVALFASTSGGATGAALAQASLPAIVTSAWNSATIYYPMAANTDYYAAVYIPGGDYGFRNGEFATDVIACPITFTADSATTYNGAFRYNTGLIAPNSRAGSHAWYGVDVEVSDYTAGDALTLTDALTANSGHPRDIASALTITDALTGYGSTPRTIASALTITDAIAHGALTYPRAVADALILTDDVVTPLANDWFILYGSRILTR